MHTLRVVSCREILTQFNLLTSGAMLCALLVVTSGLIAQSQMPAANPVIPGDHPDPTIIRTGSGYWTTSTSGDWSPQFALYRSKDLQHWTPAGEVFPHQPAWAVGSFWAPELVNDRGRILVYYVGRKLDGPLCVAAATANRPEGPYTDHGPIVCEPDGSIDPAFMRDENGTPYLIWKEDGNSQHKPTPIWAQPLTSDLLHLVGEKKQLIVNEPATWEGGVVEAPYVMRHEGHYYMFYAGSSCCGTQCNYAEGVARAEHLLGPWQKNPANPVIRPNGWWRCPGHGTAVETPRGTDYLLYHAYPVNGSIYLGRESVIDKITWTTDGWPVVNGGEGPHGPTAPGLVKFVDRFAARALDAQWRWPVNHEPKVTVGGGSLTLTAAGEGRQDFIARSLASADYVATVHVKQSSGAMGSLAVIGNQKHSTGLGLGGEGIELWRMGENGRQVLWQTKDIKAATVWLKVSSDAGKRLAYSYSLDGKSWKAAGDPIDTTNLPQWDQGLRVGLISEGSAGQTTTFRQFSLQSK